MSQIGSYRPSNKIGAWFKRLFNRLFRRNTSIVYNVTAAKPAKVISVKQEIPGSYTIIVEMEEPGTEVSFDLSKHI